MNKERESSNLKTAIGRLVGNDTGESMYVPLGFVPKYIKFFSQTLDYYGTWVDAVPNQAWAAMRDSASIPFYPGEELRAFDGDGYWPAGFIIGTLGGLLSPGSIVDFQAWG